MRRITTFPNVVYVELTKRLRHALKSFVLFSTFHFNSSWQDFNRRSIPNGLSTTAELFL